MAKPKKTEVAEEGVSEEEMWLDYFYERDSYYIAWTDGVDDGLALGESAPDADHQAATKAAKEVAAPELNRSSGRLIWESETAVRKALRAAKAAVKAVLDGAPWPDWALKAQSEGWKPPKGWRPSKV